MIRRKLKNTVKQYTEAEVLVREATSNDPWGPSSSLMSEIADLTQNSLAFQEIMQMIWKRMNDKQKNWRHVYKSLVLLDYILKTGSSRVAEQCQHNIHAIRTLRDFQYFEEHKDLGMNVREKAKAILNLLSDAELLATERQRCLKAKERFAKAPTGIGSHQGVRYGHAGGRRGGAGRYQASGGGSASGNDRIYTLRASDSTPDLSRVGRSGITTARAVGNGGRNLEAEAVDEELQLKLALALSKEEHERDMRKRREEESKEAAKLKMAMEASLKEDPSQRDLSRAGQNNLLDMDPWALPAPPASSRNAPLPAVPGNQPASALDPWGGVPKDGGVNTRGKEYDPWASGGRTYLGFADKMPSGNQSSDAFGSKPFTGGVSSAVPARFDDLLGIDLNPTPIQRPNSVTMDAFGDDLLGLGSVGGGHSGGFNGSYGLADNPSLKDLKKKSTASHSNHFGGRLVASKSAHDLMSSGFSDDDDIHEVYAIPPSSNRASEAEMNPQPNTVKDFLSQNKSLVDLDNIVTPPKGLAITKNPFQMTALAPSKSGPTVNPFNTITPKPSLNSMVAQSGSNASFTPNNNIPPGSWSNAPFYPVGVVGNYGYTGMPQNTSTTTASFNPFL